MFNYYFQFLLIHLSTLLVLISLILVGRMKKKSQTHYILLSFMSFLILWDLGLILDTYSKTFFWNAGDIFKYITHIGVVFAPVCLFLIGVVYARTKIVFTKRHLLLGLIPIISLFVLYTNQYHHLFYQQYSLNNNESVVGNYFIIHVLYSYICYFIGMYFLIYYSIKKSGFFSAQSNLIFIGCMFPIAVNIFATLKIINLTVYDTPIACSIAILFFSYAILKYNFLNITPIAMQKVVDLISDSFVVINMEDNVVDYNKTFLEMFNNFFVIKRNENIFEIFSANSAILFDVDELKDYISEARERKHSITFEKHIQADKFEKYLTVEITPILSQNEFIGTILLFKDISQSKKDMQTIKEKQTILMEQERLASLGQLIGGIAHNINTPIMSISGGIEALIDLAKEYDDAIGDASITEEDHHEIASEMTSWLNKMKPYCAYISDIVATVKGQAVQLNSSSGESFTIEELINRIQVLMNHELKKFHCNLNTESLVDINTELKGDINNLVQILDNIIMNAIHSYEGDSGDIDFSVRKADNNIEFTLKNYGKSIQPEIAERLFKEMVTTKGKNGTGLGLYMAYANIKGRFGGNMWFKSEEGKETVFYVSVPYNDTLNEQEVAE